MPKRIISLTTGLTSSKKSERKIARPAKISIPNLYVVVK
jgi:hypothetical protein